MTTHIRSRLLFYTVLQLILFITHPIACSSSTIATRRHHQGIYSLETQNQEEKLIGKQEYYYNAIGQQSADLLLSMVMDKLAKRGGGRKSKIIRFELFDTTTTNACFMNDDDGESTTTCFGDVHQYLRGSGHLLFLDDNDGGYKESAKSLLSTKQVLNMASTTATTSRILVIRYYLNPDVDQISLFEGDCQSEQEFLHVRSHHKGDAASSASSWVDLQVILPEKDDNETTASPHAITHLYCVVLQNTAIQQTNYIMAQFTSTRL